MSTAIPFTRDDLKNAKVRLLRDGRAANACVSRVSINGEDWTLKDFADRSWWVKTFLVPFLLGHEYRILSRLNGIEGVANDAFMLDRNALAIRFLPGKPLSTLKPEEITSDYLEAMESLLKEVHARGVVHLDTRGTGNWLVSPQGRPDLIDFQAGLNTQHLPLGLRHVLELIDMSGVYKKWREWHPESFGAEREALWQEAQKWRSRWKLKGYFGLKKKAGDNKFGPQ